MRAAVALRPESAHAMMNLGNGYASLGQHDQAIACYRKAIELKPDYSVLLRQSRHRSGSKKACTKRRLPPLSKPSN